MGITDYEGLAKKQELYRLALCLHVEFDVMVEMPLWEIRERAFFSGEQVVVSRMQNIQDQFHAMIMSRSDKPGKYFEEIRNDFEKDVMVERLMDPEEKKKRIAQANRAAFERMTGFGPGSGRPSPQPPFKGAASKDGGS